MLSCIQTASPALEVESRADTSSRDGLWHRGALRVDRLQRDMWTHSIGRVQCVGRRDGT